MQDTCQFCLKDDRIDLTEVGLTEEEIRDISQIYIIACGSAYHVGMAAQYVIEDMARIPVRVELASEFRYRNPILRSSCTGGCESVSPERPQTVLPHCVFVRSMESVRLQSLM